MIDQTNCVCPLKSGESLEALLDYTARKLDPVRTEILERHMSVCAECARFRDEQSAVWVALDTWTPAPVSADFNRRLWRRIDRESGAPWYSAAGWRNMLWQLRNSSWQPAIPLSAAVLVVAVGFLFDHPGRNRSVTPPGTTSFTAARVSVSEADQVQRTLDDIQLLNQFDSGSDTEAAPRAM